MGYLDCSGALFSCVRFARVIAGGNHCKWLIMGWLVDLIPAQAKLGRDTRVAAGPLCDEWLGVTTGGRRRDSPWVDGMVVVALSDGTGEVPVPTQSSFW